MHPDTDKYRQFLPRHDLSEREQADLIHAVWQIVKGFADRAFGVDETQLVLAAQRRKRDLDEANVIESDDEKAVGWALSDRFDRATQMKKGDR